MADKATIGLPSSSGRIRITQHSVFALAFGLLLWASADVLRWMAYVFREPREDMGHGWIVPIFSLAIVWLRRKELSSAIGSPSVVGLMGIIPGLLMFWVGARGDQVRITQLAMFWLLWFSAYAVYGLRFAKRLLFPVAFLLFTVPLSFLDIFTVKLRILTSALATGLLNGVGIPVARTGTGLHCLSGDGFNLDVADPCSGLRSIFALTALTAAYAYMTQKTLIRKWILFLCSAPIAVLGNLARIFSIAVVANFCGQKVATGFYHDYSGYVVFLVGILAMMQVGGLLARIKGRMDGRDAGSETPVTGSESGETGTADWQCTSWRLAVAACVPCLFLLLGVVLRHIPSPGVEPADFLVTALPPLPDYRAMYPWFCQNEHCEFEVETTQPGVNPGVCPKCGSRLDKASLGENTILPSDTGFLKCNYYDSMGEVYRIAIVINGESRLSIHRPEICLPAQGFSMENGHVETFKLKNGETLSVRCVDLRRQDSSSAFRMGQGYFFVNARERVASHQARLLITIRDRVFSNRITRWAMVTLFCQESLTSSPERIEAVGDFLSQFYSVLLANREVRPGPDVTLPSISAPNAEEIE